MKFLFYFVLAVSFGAVFLAASTNDLKAQTEMSSARQSDLPVFHYDIIKKASRTDSSMGQINITIKIAYDELQFTKKDLGFEANYEVTAVVYDEQGDQVDGTIWQKDITVQEYETTNSRNEFSFSQASFDLSPGNYEISIGLTDMDSQQKSNQTESIEVIDYSTVDFALSDITFAHSITSDSQGNLTIHPDVTDNTMGIGRELFAVYELYNNSSAESIKVTYEILNPRNKNIYERSIYLDVIKFRTPHFIQLDIDSLYHGKHIFHVELESNGEKKEIEKMFNVRWIGLPTTVTDLELAIEQLRYIAQKDEYKKLKKADDDKKLEEFQAFWQRRDPTPGTEANEVADEYYRRVQYANDSFTVFRDGWKTDMGMLYIILGPPNEIDRNPYPLQNKPYEIWYYYKINYDFVFYDERGYGEYRLLDTYSLEELLMLSRKIYNE